METVAQIFVGIDIAKTRLDVCLYGTNKVTQYSNTEVGIKKLISALSKYNVKQIVCESSGGFERLLIRTLKQAEYAIWPVNPRQMRAYIQSQGVIAKTDTIDAKLIAKFAAEREPKHKLSQYDQQQELMADITRRRHALVRCLADERKRQHTASGDLIMQSINKLIGHLEDQIVEMDQELYKLINQSAELQRKAEIIQSVPGLGSITAYTLLSLVPELGNVANNAASALIGVAPFTQQSGSARPIAHISGGRFICRTTLYMAALSLIQHNPVLKAFYKRLKLAGKSSKVAIVAVMRKVVVTINSMLAKNVTWEPQNVKYA